jgi:heme-degrading monooxygenase HmoA
MNLEIALYNTNVPPKDRRTLIRDSINAALAGMRGFQSRITMGVADDPLTLVDLVQWSDLSAANEAAKVFPTLPAFAPFGALIDSVPLFAHFDPFHQHGAFTWDGVDRGAELIIYTLRAEHSQESARFVQAYDTYLQKTPGYRGRLVLKDSEVPDRYAEVLLWESKEAAKRKEKSMGSEAHLSALRPLMEKVDLKQHLTSF